MISTGVNIVEIFSSIQGEGLYIGCRQIFIRFAGCNLSCKYCDTVHKATASFKVHFDDGTVLEEPNPIKIDRLIEIILKFNLNAHHSISLTGGEPLLHSGFLENFLCQLKKLFSIKIFLETNGVLHSNLRQVIDYIDIVSMDIKIPSTYGSEPLWESHAAFIELCLANNKELYTKIVVSNLTTFEELELVAEKLNYKHIPLIIQPISTINQAELISGKKLLAIQAELLKYFDVRVIPQTHKFLKLQ